MQLAYMRHSKHDQAATLERLKEAASSEGWRIQEGVELPSGGTVFQVCKPDWVETVVTADPQLFGLLPCSVIVVKRGDEVVVGAGSAALLGQVSGNRDLQTLAASAERAIHDLVNRAADVSDPKPVAVKLYSTKSCPFCRMEKAWLDAKKVEHTVIYIDDDEREAQRLVERTGQMGVPVTEVEFDEGDPEFIVGFDKHRLEALLMAK